MLIRNPFVGRRVHTTTNTVETCNVCFCSGMELKSQICKYDCKQEWIFCRNCYDRIRKTRGSNCLVCKGDGSLSETTNELFGTLYITINEPDPNIPDCYENVSDCVTEYSELIVRCIVFVYRSLVCVFGLFLMCFVIGHMVCSECSEYDEYVITGFKTLVICGFIIFFVCVDRRRFIAGRY